MTVLVLGGRVEEALARLAPDGLLLVVDPSAARLEELERSFPDPRLGFLIGDGTVIPVPDGSVELLIGEAEEGERRRVVRN